MLKVNDDRTTNERRIRDLECGDFFIWNDLVMRYIGFIGEDWSKAYDDKMAVMLMTTGELHALDIDTWVEPIPDRQIHLTIED